MKITQLKLYAVVSRGEHGRYEIVKSLRGGLMIYTKRSEAIAARVEESGGERGDLDAWKIVTFTADGLMTTKHKKKTDETAP